MVRGLDFKGGKRGGGQKKTGGDQSSLRSPAISPTRLDTERNSRRRGSILRDSSASTKEGEGRAIGFPEKRRAGDD